MAGSGKTSIALHRIAFLLYRFKESITSKDILILSPNKVFADYISNVLPELGEEKIPEIGMEELASTALEDNFRFQTFFEQVSLILNQADPAYISRIRFKATSDFLGRLNQFLVYIENNYFTATDLLVGKYPVPAFFIEERFKAHHRTPLLNRFTAVAKDIEENVRIYYKYEISGAERSKLRAAVKKMFKTTSLRKLYQDFYNWLEKPEMLKVAARSTLEFSDVFPLIYLKIRLEGLKTYGHIKQLLVDEMQDYTPVQYSVLASLFPCKKTILGDANQSVNPYSSSTAEGIQQVFPGATLVKLNKSYRSTYEITNFAQQISQNAELEAIQRHGEEPSIKRLDTPAQELAAIKKELEVFSSSGHKSLGIICKTQAQANALYEQLKDEAVKIKLLNANSSSFGHGIILTTAHLAKGLEFDQVVVPYASAENYQTAVDKSMLYIACTRAMHRLSLSCVGEISSLARKKSNEVKSLKMVKVSVLLPVRNGEATLSTALDSLWSQSLPDFEVVLVNDGSTDATSDIIAACTDERLKVINLPPCGIAAALNKGLQHCSAPLVARMDADDVAHPQRLEKQWRFMQQHSEVAVLASCVVYGGNAESKQGYARYVAAINQLITHQQMWNRRFWDAPLAHPSVMYHKQVVLAAGGYSQEAVPEDYDLWLRLFARGCFFAKLTEKLIIWNDGEDRLSRTHPNYDKKAFWRLKAQYFADWLRATYGDAAPKIYLWGETSRKQRSRYLLEAGVTIAGRIHYDAQPTNPELIPYTAVPHLKNCLILVYVSNRMGQQQIMDYLSSHGFTEGQDFFLMV